MGRRHNEVATEEKIVPYKIVGGPEDYVKVDDRRAQQYTPPEISAMILRKLKEAAEAYLGHKVNKAVITVPAYFNDAQRQATKDAGQIAGPGSGADHQRADGRLAGLRPGQEEGRRRSCVFDLGGGTFDVSVLEVADGVFRVISTNGDTHLGGDDFDQVLIDYVRRRVQEARTASTSARTRWPCSGSRRPARRPRRSSARRRRPTSTCPSSRPTPPARSTCK